MKNKLGFCVTKKTIEAAEALESGEVDKYSRIVLEIVEPAVNYKGRIAAVPNSFSEFGKSIYELGKRQKPEACMICKEKCKYSLTSEIKDYMEKHSEKEGAENG